MIELERQKKVLSMMMTAHSVLKGRYSSLSTFFDVFLIIASAILNVVVFLDESFIKKHTGLDPATQKVIAGFASVAVFTISIILLRVRWREKAEDHAKAVDQLFQLMQESRRISNLQSEKVKEETFAKFNDRYTDVLSSIAQIPDRRFNSLKMIHNRKVELSKMIERYPGSRLIILKIKLFFSSFKEKKK
jgi:hypothetical protein